MIALDVADLVVIASRMLGLDTGQVLDLLDVAAAERALAQARPGSKAAGPGSKAHAGDLEAAAALRDREKLLLTDKLRLERQLEAGQVGPGRTFRPSSGKTSACAAN